MSRLPSRAPAPSSTLSVPRARASSPPPAADRSLFVRTTGSRELRGARLDVVRAVDARSIALPAPPRRRGDVVHALGLRERQRDRPGGLLGDGLDRAGPEELHEDVAVLLRHPGRVQGEGVASIDEGRLDETTRRPGTIGAARSVADLPSKYPFMTAPPTVSFTMSATETYTNLLAPAARSVHASDVEVAVARPRLVVIRGIEHADARRRRPRPSSRPRARPRTRPWTGRPRRQFAPAPDLTRTPPAPAAASFSTTREPTKPLPPRTTTFGADDESARTTTPARRATTRGERRTRGERGARGGARRATRARRRTSDVRGRGRRGESDADRPRTATSRARWQQVSLARASNRRHRQPVICTSHDSSVRVDRGFPGAPRRRTIFSRVSVPCLSKVTFV